MPILRFLFAFTLIILLASCSNSFQHMQSSQSDATHSQTIEANTNGILNEQALRVRTDHIRQLIQGMTLEQKLGQLIMVEYFGNQHGYTYQTTELPMMISQGAVGGILYQAANYNFTAPNNTVSGFKNFITQTQKDAKIPLLQAVDQEGGLVTKLSTFFGPAPSALEMAQSQNIASVQAQGKQSSGWLKQLGLNVNLAPVADVGPPSNLLQTRMFGSDPQTVTTYAGAFLTGLQQNGTIGCVKHFSGLGSLPQGQDPHAVLPVVNRSLADVQRIDLAPYKQLIATNHPAMIMTTNVITKAIDPILPAEFSPKAINILRKDFGYNGVIITDGLYMVKNYWSLSQAAVMAISAGNDIIEGPYTTSQVTTVIAALKAAITQGTISQANIDQSLQRILLMKTQYGILS
ncbi:glycoside hydrolase family 3 protein [Tengunoibacter tsumagoiensis]